MKEVKQEYFSLRDIKFLIKPFLFFVFSKWWLFLFFISAGAGVAFIYYNVQKPRYDAVTTFILEEKSAGGGGLAGLASQFGFDMASLGAGGSMFSGDNILDILRSKKIIHKVLLSKAGDNKNLKEVTLADKFLHFSGWKERWAKKIGDVNFKAVFSEQDLTQKQDSVLNEIHKFLLEKSITAERVNKKGSIIKVQVSSVNSLFARLMTERLVEESARLYLDIKTGTAQTNIANMQRRSDSLLRLLNRKSYSAALSQPLDINPGIKAAAVPVEIATRDKTVIATLYVEVTKNLETSKLLMSQQTPIIQLLDRPGYLLDDHKRKLPFLLVVAALSSAMIFISIALILFVTKKNKSF